jgi:hypothetical protein
MPIILATRETEIRRISGQGQPRQKVQETCISTSKKLGMVEYACHPSYVGNINRRIAVQASLGTHETLPKNN